MGGLPTIKLHDDDIVCELFDGPLDGALIVVPPECKQYVHEHKMLVGSVFMYTVKFHSYVYKRDPNLHKFVYVYPHTQLGA